MLASHEATREEFQPQRTESVNSDKKDGSLFAALASIPLTNYLILPLPFVMPQSPG